jgi:hypothetical protein
MDIIEVRKLNCQLASRGQGGNFNNILIFININIRMVDACRQQNRWKNEFHCEKSKILEHEQ